MNDNFRRPAVVHLVWVFTDSLIETLHAATWLDTTHELRKLGWRVTLIAPGPPGRQHVRGVEVLCFRRPEIYCLRQVVFHIGVLRFLAREWATIDVILFHSMSAPWLSPLRLVRSLTRRRRPLLALDVRTMAMTPTSIRTWKERLRQAILGFVGRWFSRWVDGRLAITYRMAESLHIPTAKLWGVWPSGVDPDRFGPAQLARRWPTPGEPVHLIYIGCLHRERNLMTLSHAVERANCTGMAFILSLVGDGTERQDLEEFAAQTEGRIRVVAPVRHDRVPEMLAKAHVGVLPFPDEEKFRVSSPIKLFEYMAAGLPILATRIACHTDVVQDGRYAYWAEDADEDGLFEALRQVWHSRDSLGEMGRQAVIAVQAWTWRESAKKLRMALECGLSTCQ